jgi:AbrB family looped-hinge helix DNA binding protein
MPAATLTSKGQITVPKTVREALGVHPGDRIAFRVYGDGAVVMEAETMDLTKMRGVLKPGVRGVTTKAMDDAIRRAAARQGDSG